MKVACGTQVRSFALTIHLGYEFQTKGTTTNKPCAVFSSRDVMKYALCEEFRLRKSLTFKVTRTVFEYSRDDDSVPSK